MGKDKLKKLWSEALSTPSEVHAAGLGPTLTVLMFFSWHYMDETFQGIATVIWLGSIGIATGLFYMEELDAPFFNDIRREGHYYLVTTVITILAYIGLMSVV